MTNAELAQHLDNSINRLEQNLIKRITQLSLDFTAVKDTIERLRQIHATDHAHWLQSHPTNIKSVYENGNDQK